MNAHIVYIHISLINKAYINLLSPFNILKKLMVNNAEKPPTQLIARVYTQTLHICIH